ncbi:MAG: enoyl-CoA hydratase/isomerase family protein [Microthrixaceae bacterium]
MTQNRPDYQSRYELVDLERKDGILCVRLHSGDGPLRWGLNAHREFETIFRDIADDRENRVVIITGTGDEFIGPKGSFGGSDQVGKLTPRQFDDLRPGAHQMLLDLLRIDVPVICAVNGPAVRHAEIPALCDIVLASDTASFQDSSHFINHMPPGDGQHVIMPLVMGMNRARYYLLMGEEISAERALQFGLVNEIHPPDLLMDRAWDVARSLARQPILNLRATRRILTKQIRRAMEDLLEYGLDLEGFALVDPEAETHG